MGLVDPRTARDVLIADATDAIVALHDEVKRLEADIGPRLTDFDKKLEHRVRQMNGVLVTRITEFKDSGPAFAERVMSELLPAIGAISETSGKLRKDAEALATENLSMIATAAQDAARQTKNMVMENISEAVTNALISAAGNAMEEPLRKMKESLTEMRNMSVTEQIKADAERIRVQTSILEAQAALDKAVGALRARDRFHSWRMAGVVVLAAVLTSLVSFGFQRLV